MSGPRQNTPEAFRKQLLSGHYNELRVALYFMLRGHAVRLGFDGQSFDLTVVPGPEFGSRAPFRVEVKWDRHSQQSGNCYFEFRNTRSGQPSGVASSQADWWCHVLGEGERALLMPLKVLRGWLESGGFRELSTRGVDSNSRGWIVPLSRLRGESRFLEVDLPTPESYFDDLLKAALPTGGDGGSRRPPERRQMRPEAAEPASRTEPASEVGLRESPVPEPSSSGSEGFDL